MNEYVYIYIYKDKHFFLFQPNEHNTLNTHIFTTSYFLHVSVFVTPFSGRPMRYLQKKLLFAMSLHSFAIKCTTYPDFKFKILLQCIKQYQFHHSIP